MTVGENDTVKFKFYVNVGSKLDINVYGVDMGQENKPKNNQGDVHNWDETKMHYYSAPANDRSSVGVDLSGVYKGAPIANIDINGAGFYEIDVCIVCISFPDKTFFVFVINF